MVSGKRRVVDSATALLDELDSRLNGAPDAYREGDRIVPVTYALEVQPLETRLDYDERDVVARHARHWGPAESKAAGKIADTAFRLLVHAQQSDDGIGTHFMTPNEKLLASDEWSRRLRALVKASDKAKAARAPRVLVDLQDDD